MMKKTIVKAFAKINICIDVLKKREDNYHELKMIMQDINLCDEVTVQTIENGIEITCNKSSVPTDHHNIVYKACKIMIERFSIKSGFKIHIEKRIPVAAGLAGGSSDCAAVLKAINELFLLELDNKELETIGKEVGSDVPYCIRGGTVLAQGRGEILTDLPTLPKTNLVLVKPLIDVSTQWVYSNLDIKKIKTRPDIDLIIELIRKKDINNLSQNIINVLELVTIKKYEIIQEIKDVLLKKGAKVSLMSGSGPSVFGVFESFDEAKIAFESIKNDNRWECFLTHTLNIN